jgi:retinol dehydrogenase 12
MRATLPTVMQGKVVVITGGTSGIGQVAAEKLAAMGARVVLVARNKARGEQTLARLRSAAPATAHSVHYADLSRLSEMKRVGAQIAAAEPHIDLLINNAGAMFSQRHVTEDGLEMTFAVNHMSYFVLTLALWNNVVASAPARIVNTSSHAHFRAHIDFDDLQSERDYKGFQVYGRSKLANILFTRELARRLRGTGVTANCLHPGFVATRIGDESGGKLAPLVRVLKLFAISPEKGAETLVYLASSDQAAKFSGAYFFRSEMMSPSVAARDDDAARRLWAESERLAGL